MPTSRSSVGMRASEDSQTQSGDSAQLVGGVSDADSRPPTGRGRDGHPDDEEYIVRLVGQVVRVSVETVKLVKGLPKKYA